MTKKNYKLDNNEMTITADWAKLNTADRVTVKEFIELGYTFQNKSSRDGAKRTVSHFENNLIESDRAIFNELREARGADGKKVKGAYSRAASFATNIIKLGKYVDENPDKASVLEEYRTLVQLDFVQAKLYVKEVLKVA